MNKFLILLCTIALLFSSCRKVIGDGPTITDSRSVSTFDALDISVSADVDYTPSTNSNVTIEAQRNILDVIETFVQSGRLRIKFRDRVNVRGHERIRIHVSGPDLRAISLSGSGNTNVNGTMNSNSLALEVSGSGNLFLSGAQTDVISARVSGSGSIRVASGSANRADIHVSGSGDVDMSPMQAQVAETHTSGSGTIRLKVQQRLEAHVSGSGNVWYLGQPQVTTHISGSGSVRPF
ncbi:MAG: DUF2807 domain-containing protein [Chitinophagaceae bacterium]|nr:MAG: DUF2807 domain-containing protein [Chitinophagaceae bacterium]